MTRSKWLLAVLALTACWTSKKETGMAAPADGVTVELSAVTLSEDCGDTGTLPAPLQTAAAERVATPPASTVPSAIAADCEPPCTGYGGGCDPTTMQLSLHSTATAPTAIAIKKVELLDDGGKVLGVLTARTPSRWGGGSYEAWDELVPAGQTLSASYRLSAPLWEQIVDGGRYQAHTKKFQLRVTVGVGTGERTVEKRAISVAMMEPPVPT